jgi:thiamine phosphate synthase YjbQ (UPF0047 family)
VKHATDYLWFETANRRDYLNITGDVEAFITRESAYALSRDARRRPIPDRGHRVSRIMREHFPRLNNGEHNADAHLKRQLMAHQVVLPITDGKLDLGPWEQVFYAEFDGRRRKRVVLKATGE